MRLIVVAGIIGLGCSGPVTSLNHLEFLLDWKAQMEHAGFFVAAHNGYYEEEGLSVKILEGSGAPVTARLVGNGTYVLGVSSGSATVIARSKGIPIISLAVINQHSPVVVYALLEKRIMTPKDLIGKKIGVNIGGTKYREFQAFLRKVGIKENQLQIMGTMESSPAPLLTEQVDALLGYTEDQPVSLELRGHSVSRLALSDYGINLYSTNIVANADFLKQHSNIVKRFINASMKGWAFAVEHPDRAVMAYMKTRPESDADFNRANFKRLIPILHSPDVNQLGLGAQTIDRWNHTQTELFNLGLITQKSEVAQLFTNAFLPTSRTLK